MEDKEIALCYCGNDKMGKGILLSSLSASYVAELPVHVYLLTASLKEGRKEYHGLTKEQASFIEKALKAHNSANSVTLVDCKEAFLTCFKHCINRHSVYTPYAYMRLILDELPNMPKRMLYLDADTIVMKPLAPLFEMELANYDIALVSDAIGRHYFGKRYGNSGVLLINLERVRQNGAFKRVRHYVNHVRLFMPDQTALNRVLNKTKLLLPNKYNEQLDTTPETVIRHYCKRLYWLPVVHTVSVKPWEVAKFRGRFGAETHKALLNEYVSLLEEGKHGKFPN